ncbi:ATP-binding protein [Candidatus Woesearchaeota archaeon]|jgi:uncharacterized protein|nr:ATP-binding protein [Candidatus Woesearchaeota archaeon]
MILGKIIGKTTTTKFSFIVENPLNAKKFEYIQVFHTDQSISDEPISVLAQILELVRDSEKTLAYCSVIGFRNNQRTQSLRSPLEPGCEVLKAEDELINDIIKLDSSAGAYIGKILNKNIPVYLDLNKLITKHCAVLAKSGSGKSYTVGVLLEEIIEKGVPLIIIDPHGEYNSLKFPNTTADKQLFERFNTEPKGFIHQVQEFGDHKINPDVKPLRLSEKFDTQELINLFPSKPNASQLACIYSAVKNLETMNFDSLIYELGLQDNNAKWTLIDVLDYYKTLDLFSPTPTQLNELICPNKCTIINLKGIEPEAAELIVHKLMKDLFEARKRESIPPFFAVIEEAHLFCPEKVFSEARSTKILRTIASEGRKFGLGLCVVSQRPARVDKSVLSQLSTQIILKSTNPNDLKAISQSVEGITAESQDEIKNLSIGTALVTGVVDIPLLVQIRPRKSKHGGEAKKLIQDQPTISNSNNSNNKNNNNSQDSINNKNTDIKKPTTENNNSQTNKPNNSNQNFVEESKKFENLIPLIKPRISVEELRLMSESPIEKIETYLIPALFINCDSFNILVDLVQGKVIKDIDANNAFELPDIAQLSPNQLNILSIALELKEFGMAHLIGKGLEFHHSQNMLKDLMGKELITCENQKYSLNNKLALNLEKVSFIGRVEYGNTKYDTKIEPTITQDTILAKVSPLTKVIESKECFIIWNKINYKEESKEETEEEKTKE